MENSVKFARNNYSALKDIQFDIKNAQNKSMTVKSKPPEDKVDFSISSRNGSDNVTGKVTDENLIAMSAVIVSNLQTKLKENPNAALAIDLKSCTPPEVAQRFLDKINAERERVAETLMKSHDPSDFVLAEKLRKVQSKMPDMPTATVHITESDTSTPKKVPKETPRSQSVGSGTDTPSRNDAETSENTGRNRGYSI